MKVVGYQNLLIQKSGETYNYSDDGIYYLEGNNGDREVVNTKWRTFMVT